ncbi:hypothetical protein O7599_23295 [Streptomyces sp. WMMC500]|uniref:hypothetical protein n=1 Tax=Streptomyces sp. WMMC500 TaxID=3015154 RepID=UPI00248C6546|nr:hypothetical protein [Streptomyces sp. WMMC500]WBB58550.1 hypothetical protein O7599_23295 [Streptomyces sp. WMMC500]
MPRNQARFSIQQKTDLVNEWVGSGLSQREFVQQYIPRYPGGQIALHDLKRWAREAKNNPERFSGVDPETLRAAYNRTSRSREERADVLNEFRASRLSQEKFVKKYNGENPDRKISQPRLSEWLKEAREQENWEDHAPHSSLQSFDNRPAQPSQQPSQPQAAPYDYDYGDEARVAATTRQFGALSVTAPTDPSAPWRHDPWFGAGPEPGEEELAANPADFLYTGHDQPSAHADSSRYRQVPYSFHTQSPPITVNPNDVLYERRDQTVYSTSFADTPHTVGYTQHNPTAFSPSFDAYGAADHAFREPTQGGESSAPQPPPPAHGRAGRRKAQKHSK